MASKDQVTLQHADEILEKIVKVIGRITWVTISVSEKIGGGTASYSKSLVNSYS